MSLFDEVNRAMQAMLSTARHQTCMSRWCPAADIYRTRAGWCVKLELAGVSKDDIVVTVLGQILSVRGRRRDTLLTEAAEHYSLEISYSEFERRVELPCDLEQADVSAEFREGMLLVNIVPKVPEG